MSKSIRFTFYNNGGRGKVDLKCTIHALQLTNTLPAPLNVNSPALQVVVPVITGKEMVVRGPESPDSWEEMPARPSLTKRPAR